MTEVAVMNGEGGWSTLRIVVVSSIVMLLSFAFGIAMFLPAEHRAEKLTETMNRYQARNPDADQVQPDAKKRILLPSTLGRLPVLTELGGDFVLDSSLGRPLGPADFRGLPLLVNFGYTGCPDVCPTTLRRLRDVLNAFPDHELRALFVTLDPAQDDADRLADYLAFFGPSFIGLTGNEAAVREVTSHYRVYQEVDAASGSISHSNEIYLLDGDGRTRATFNANVTVAEMINTVDRLL